MEANGAEPNQGKGTPTCFKTHRTEQSSFVPAISGSFFFLNLFCFFSNSPASRVIPLCSVNRLRHFRARVIWQHSQLLSTISNSPPQLRSRSPPASPPLVTFCRSLFLPLHKLSAHSNTYFVQIIDANRLLCDLGHNSVSPQVVRLAAFFFIPASSLHQARPPPNSLVWKSQPPPRRQPSQPI